MNVSELPKQAAARAARSWILTDPRLLAFFAWVRKHYGNQEALAEELVTNRAHLSQVLHGERNGKHTWKRLVKMLPEDGLSLLQQCPSWNAAAEAAFQKRKQANENII